MASSAGDSRRRAPARGALLAREAGDVGERDRALLGLVDLVEVLVNRGHAGPGFFPVRRPSPSLSAAAKRFCISAATCLARSMSCAAALAAIEVSTRAKPTRPQVARESFIAISWSSRANAPPPHYRQQMLPLDCWRGRRV
jgi:hypothetical protein